MYAAMNRPRNLSGVTVRELGDGAAGTHDAEVDWMENLLGRPFFRDIPPDSIYNLLKRFHPVPARAGQIIIQQGDEGAHFYVLSQGRAEVIRVQPNGDEVRLDECIPGDGFGEEALLSGARRNATIRMLTDGVVQRLEATDFNKLVREPVVVNRAVQESSDLIADKNGIWMDVRLSDEFECDGLPDTFNLPLPLLRRRIERLDKKRPVVAFCDTGGRSAVAVYLMRERGIDAWLLEGGLEALRNHRAGNNASS